MWSLPDSDYYLQCFLELTRSSRQNIRGGKKCTRIFENNVLDGPGQPVLVLSPLGSAGPAPDLIAQYLRLTSATLVWRRRGKILQPSCDALSKGRTQRVRAPFSCGLRAAALNYAQEPQPHLLNREC